MLTVVNKFATIHGKALKAWSWSQQPISRKSRRETPEVSIQTRGGQRKVPDAEWLIWGPVTKHVVARATELDAATAHAHDELNNAAVSVVSAVTVHGRSCSNE